MNPLSDSPFPGGSPVVVYLRYSGDGQTIESQENAVRAWCAEQHLAILRVYRDEAKSGTSTAGRDDFLAMVDALRDGVVLPRPAGVVLWSFSRFARDYDDAQYYTALLRRNGYEIKSMTDAIPAGEIGRVVESLHHWMNAEAARRIGQDAKRGLLWLAEQGYWHGAPPPRGYKLGDAVRVGLRKNGTERIAHKLVFDPDWEARVRGAWQAKLQGALNWQIHNEFRIYPAINSYTTFFGNHTYAGIVKCGDRKFPNAHPAYVSIAEFERVLHMRRVMPHNASAPDGDPQHSKRQQSPFLLSGLFYCGMCGYVMSGQRYGETMFYKCGRRHRHGPNACRNKSIVAWYVHDLVLDWLCANVFTRDYLFANRDQINARIGGDRSVLESRRKQISEDLARIDGQVKHLIDSIARLGLTDPIERAIQERQADARALEHDLAEVNAQLNQQRIELADDALDYIAAHLREEVQGDSLEDVRRVLRQVLVRVEIAEKEMTLYYASPLIERPKSVIAQLPPWDNCLNDAPFIQAGILAYSRPPTGSASPLYSQ